MTDITPLSQSDHDLCDFLLKSTGRFDLASVRPYLLDILFYRILSDALEESLNTVVDGVYAELSDADAEQYRDRMSGVLGYYMLPSELFSVLVAHLDENKNVAGTLLHTFMSIDQPLYDHEHSRQYVPADTYRDIFMDFDLNFLALHVAELNTWLMTVVKGVARLDMSDPHEVFRRVYDCVMRMPGARGLRGTTGSYAQLAAAIVLSGRASVNAVYDPCCGSADMLLAVKAYCDQNGVVVEHGFYGEEPEADESALGRMRLLMSDLPLDTFSLQTGDTLKKWTFRHNRFDTILTHPRFGAHWDPRSVEHDPRFTPAGVLASRNNADWAYVMDVVSCLSDEGTAAVIFPTESLWRVDSAERTIRHYLLDMNVIDTVIEMPSRLLMDTTVSTSLLVLRKNKTDQRIRFINATDQFVDETYHRSLSEDNMRSIMAAYQSEDEIDGVMRLVTVSEMKAHNGSLYVPDYILGAENPREDFHSMMSHMEQSSRNQNADMMNDMGALGALATMMNGFGQQN